MLEKFLSHVYGLAAKSADEPELRVRRNGFDIVRTGQVFAAIELGNIKEISAFKRDLGTTDLVCFEIMVISNVEPIVYEVNEEMSGFDELVRLFEQLPVFRSNWRELVIKPPFSSQRVTILQRSPNPTGGAPFA